MHLSSWSCFATADGGPDTTAALERLSREYAFPVLCLSFDERASETGVRTRTKAFCDMLKLRRRRQRAGDELPDTG